MYNTLSRIWGDMFQDPQWIIKTMGSNEIYLGFYEKV